MATFFVNARWTAADSGHPSSITWGTNNNYDVEWYDFDRGLNGEVTYSSGGAYCTSDLQAAINFAHENDTIVFYNVGGGEDIEDFKFYAQDTISVDKSLSFRTGSLSDTSKQSYTAKTVKFDALKIVPGSGLSGVTLSLGQGLYSTDDILDVNGTLELLNGAVFSADLVQNDADNGVIVVDTVSRFVADSIEDGMIEIKSGYVDNEKLKWIDRPVMARVGNGVKVRFISPDGDVLLGEQGTGTYKMVHVAKKKTAATPGAAAIYYYTDDDSGNPQTPSAVSAAPDDYTVYNYHVVTDNESLILVSDVFDLAGGSAPYTTAALYVDSTWTSGSTFEGQGQDKSTSPVAINSQYDGTTIVMNSIVAAMECPYVITTHTFDKVDQGVVIRIKEKPHDSESPEDWYIYDESSNSLSGNIRDIIIEPDKYLGADGKWHYDKVGIIFGNLPTSTPNMISFSHLESLEIGDWQFGTAGGRPGVLSFADIKHFTITTKLKTLGGSTTRIVNCPDVISETHFSVTGSTLIIENSNVTLNYGTSDGVLSTENNWLGSGSVIIRNSTFKVKSGSTAFYTVNLKKDAEFIITGDCTVDAMFSNLTGNDSDTHITFRDAVLGSDSNIRPLDSKPDMGADLHFEGNNTFDGATVTQAGGQDMLLDPGATLDLSNGASVTLPNYGDEISEITNNGLISLSSGSSITGGVITNAPDSSMTIDGTSHIQTDHFENSTGAVFTVALNADGTLPIQSLSEGVDVEIVNHGTMVLDAGGLNYTPNHIPIDSIGGDGNIILKVQGGGVEIMEDPVTGEKYIQMSQPDTSTLYVNMDWSTCSTGQNVGLFTYYGYNAFSDNGNPDNPQDSMWKAIRDEDNPTKRLVYTGVSGSVSYGDLDLSQSAAEHGVTIRTASSGSKVSANFGAMTAGTAPVMLSGATANIDSVEVKTNGSLYVTPGESAKLVLSVAYDTEPRDVQVEVINDGTKETETFTVRVPAGETIVELSSGKFTVGQSYYVSVTDKSVIPAKHEQNDDTRKLTINVAIVREVERHVDVTVRGAEDTNRDTVYTFRNCQVPQGKDKLSLNPDFKESDPVRLDSVTDEHKAAHTGRVFYDGGWKLEVEQDSESAHTVTATVSNGNQTLAYTFTLRQGTGTETVLLPTQLIENTEYYVMVKEPVTTATAMTDSLDGSDVNADSVVNNGTLTVASENQTRKITLKNLPKGKDRTAHVLITADGFSKETDILIPRSDDDAGVDVVIYSDDFTAGVEYLVEITDSGDILPTQYCTAADDLRKAAQVTLNGLEADDTTRKITVACGSAAYTVFVSQSETSATFAAEDFEVGESYAMTVTDGTSTTTYGAAKIVLTGLDKDSTAARRIDVAVGGAHYAAIIAQGATTATIASMDFVIGNTYDLTVTDGVTTKTYTGIAASACTAAAPAPAQTLSHFSAASVTNKNRIVVEDADFSAGTLDNRTGKSVEAINANLSFGTDTAVGTLTNAGSFNVSGSVVTVGTSALAGTLTNSGSIALNTLAAAGEADILSSLTVYGDVTNSGSISYVFVDASGMDEEVAAAQKFRVIGGSVDNTGGTITIDATAFDLEGESKLVADFAVTGGIVVVTGKDGVSAVRDDDHKVWLLNLAADTTTLYVNNVDSASWVTTPGVSVDWDGLEGLKYKLNAFADAATASEGLASDTESIVFKGAASDPASYGALDLSAASNAISVTARDNPMVSLGMLSAASSVTLSSIDLSASGVSNSGTLAVTESARLTVSGDVTNSGTVSYKFVDGEVAAQIFQVIGGSVDNTGGTITIDVSDADFTGIADRMIQVTGFAVNGGVITITGTASTQGLEPGETVTAIRKTSNAVDNTVWLIATPADTTTLYVDNDSADAWEDELGTLIANPDDPDDPYTLAGKWNPDSAKLYYGVNAFVSAPGTVNGITSRTTTVEFKGGNSDNYGAFDLSAVLNDLTIKTDDGVAAIGALTTGVEKAVTLDGAELNADGAVTNNGTLEQETSGSLTAASFVNNGVFDQTAGAVTVTGGLTNNEEAEMTFAVALTAASIANYGVLDASGTVAVQDPGEVRGDVENKDGATFTLSGTLTAAELNNNYGATFTQTAGSINVQSLVNAGRLSAVNATVTGTSDVTNSASGIMTLRGNFTATGAALTNNGTLNQTAGTLAAVSVGNNGIAMFSNAVTLSGALTNTGTLNQASGSISATSFTNAADATATFRPDATDSFTGGITNNGTLNHSFGTVSTTSFTNAADATFLQTAATPEAGGDPDWTELTVASFSNSGTVSQLSRYAKITVTGTSNVTNSATGIMNLSGDFIASSAVFANTGALNLKSSVSDGAEILGSMSVKSLTNAEGASVTINGDLTVTNTSGDGIVNNGSITQTGGTIDIKTTTSSKGLVVNGPTGVGGTFTQTGGVLIANCIKTSKAKDSVVLGGEATIKDTDFQESSSLKVNGTLTVTNKLLGRRYTTFSVEGTDKALATVTAKDLTIWRGSTARIVNGTLTVTSTTGLSDSTAAFTVGDSGMETQSTLKAFKFLLNDKDGYGTLTVYKGGLLELGTGTGTGTDKGLLAINDKGTRSILINGGTVHAANVSNQNAFTIKGEAVIDVAGTFSGVGSKSQVELAGATLNGDSRIVMTDGLDKTLVITSGTNNTVDGAEIIVNKMYLNGGFLTVSNLNGENRTFTVRGAVTNAKRLSLKNGGTLSAASIANTTETKAIDICAGSKVTVTGAGISGGIINIGTVDDNGDSILNDDFYILAMGAIDSGVALTVDVFKSGDVGKAITVGGDPVTTVGGLGSSYGVIDGTGYNVTTLGGTGLFLTKANASVLYVNSAYAESGLTDDGHLIGYNAFRSFSAALNAAYALPDSVGTVTIKVASETDAAQNFLGYPYPGGFLNNVVLEAAGEDPVTVTVPFEDAGDGLFLTPAAGMNVTVAAGLTIATGHDEGATDEDNGAVYLNYYGTSGTVTVNGTISAARGIKIYGESEINGTLTCGTDGEDSVIVLRSGKANTSTKHAEVTIGREEGNTDESSQVNATWIHYISGDVETNNTVIEVTGFKYANNPGVEPAEHEFTTGASVLTSTNTTWNVWYMEAADNVTCAGEFNFSGGSFNVSQAKGLGSNEAVELGASVTVNLADGALFSVAAGAIDNAGTICLRSASQVTAAAISNTNKITVEAGSTITVTGTGIAGGVLNIATVDGTSQSVLNDDFYILATGAVDSGVTLTVDDSAKTIGGAASITVGDIPTDGVSIDGTGYTLTTLGGTGLFLTNQSASVLYVSSAYTGSGLTGDGHLIDYNAFSSFNDTLVKAQARTAADPESTTVVEVVSSPNTVAFSNDLPYDSINGLTVRKAEGTLGDVVITYKNTASGFRMDLLGGAYTIEDGVKFNVIGDPGTLGGGLWLNYHGQESADAAVVSGDLAASSMVGFQGLATVNDTATITAPHLYLRSGAKVVTVTGKGKAYYDAHEGEYQIDGHPQTPQGEVPDSESEIINGALVFMNGTMDISGSNVWGRYLTFSNDGWLHNNGTAVLNSTDTTWTIEEDMKSDFYDTYHDDADTDQEGTTGTFRFTNSSLNIGGNVLNSPSAGRPTMTIGLTNSTMTVGGSIQNSGAITMDKDSLIKATSITNSGAGSITIDATGFSGMKKVIDLATGTVTASLINAPAGVSLAYDTDGHDYWLTDAGNSVIYLNQTWTGMNYGDLIGSDTKAPENVKEYYGYNATGTSSSAKALAAAANATINVTGGSFTTSNAPTFDGIATTISGGSFGTSVCGGNLFTGGEGIVSIPVKATAPGRDTLSLTIDGGTFDKIVFAGDRVHDQREVTRTADIEMTISGGVFNNSIAGGMALTNADGFATLSGSVNLTIKGGTFNDTNDKNVDWIYGGCIASTKMVGASTTITGDVTVTLDTTVKNITIANLVVGSYGAGRIDGNAKLVLKGTNSVVATGEIWGGCSSDSYGGKIGDTGNRSMTSKVSGNRILSFTGFRGVLESKENKIRAFSDLVVEKDIGTGRDSDVTLNTSKSENVLSLSDVINWTFEKGSKLTGNFVNDFNGDTLNLKGFVAGDAGTVFTLMSDSVSDSTDIFSEFGKLADIKMGGESVGEKAYTEATMTWAWSDSTYDYSLAVNDGKLQFSFSTIA